MKAGLSKLTTKDLATLAERVINATKQSNIQEAKTHSFLNQLENIYESYSAVLFKTTYSGKGKSVAIADKERNLCVRSLKLILNGYSKLKEFTNYSDAVSLYDTMKVYGLNLDKLSYSEQTAQINKLIESFEKDTNKTKLETLHLTEIFELLKQSQENFKTIYDEQAVANAALRKIKSASILRKDMEKSLKRYLDYVTLMIDTPQWKPLYNQLNEYVKASKKTSNNKEEKESLITENRI